MTPKAVLFDLGDTLWHFPKMPAAMDIRTETVRRVSGAVTVGACLSKANCGSSDGHQAWCGEADRAAYEPDCVSPDFNEVVRGIVAEKGRHHVRAGDAALGRLEPGRVNARQEDVRRRLETLDWLRDHGYRLGCVTNRVFGGPRFVDEMKELGLDKYFESVAVSCDIGYMKPHPQCYQYTLDEMKLDPGECVGRRQPQGRRTRCAGAWHDCGGDASRGSTA